jgi:hypothetical protein
MELNISSQDQAVTGKLKQLITRQVRFALSRFESRIRDVSVHLQDLNGPKGGLDKDCRIRVRLRGGGSVLVQVTDVEFEPAIHRATDRAARVVQRRWQLARTQARAAATGWKDKTGVGE